MTESQAWREIAKRIGSNFWRRSGLCDEVNGLWKGGYYFRSTDRDDVAWRDGDRITPLTYKRMLARVRDHMAEMEYPHERDGRIPFIAWQLGEHEVRCLAALFLSLEAKDEEKSP